VDDPFSQRGIQSQAVDIVDIIVELIETELGHDEDKDQYAAGHPDAEAGDIDKGIPFVLRYIPDSGFQVVLEHFSLL
jgi:hypothetical protein